VVATIAQIAFTYLFQNQYNIQLAKKLSIQHLCQVKDETLTIRNMYTTMVQSISSNIKKLNRLEVVLKTVERCNINCSYCYFFNDKDKAYLKHPKYISMETVKEVTKFLLAGIEDLKIENLVIIIHGGEPLLQKKKIFDTMCGVLNEKLRAATQLSFSIQTNALLIDNDWIELFEKYNIAVGVSIDGPKVYNDQFRIDHKGKGTYDRLKSGLKQLFEASRKNKIKKVASLSVIHPSFSAKLIYHHLVHELGFTVLDFLLPDLTYETASKTVPEQIKSYLSDLFYAWKADDNPDIHIRILDVIVRKMLAEKKGTNQNKNANQIISISTGGQIVPNDILRNTQYWDSKNEPLIFSNSLLKVLNSELFSFLRTSESNIPSFCKGCCWSDICKGGELINRYSIKNNFDNPSIYCDALKELYLDIAGHLLTTGGITYEALNKNLNIVSYTAV